MNLTWQRGRDEMDDLISRQAAIALFYKHPNVDWTTLDVLNELKSLPSVQPDIICCCNCKHWQRDKVFGGGYCFGHITKGWHYCGYAERREDE